MHRIVCGWSFLVALWVVGMGGNLAFGDCTPGTKYNWGATVCDGPCVDIWQDDSSSGYVPMSLAPPGFPGSGGTHSQNAIYKGVGCDPGYAGWNGGPVCWDYGQKITVGWFCGSGWGWAVFGYGPLSTQNEADYDCDGIVDNGDNHPAEAESLDGNLGSQPKLCNTFRKNPVNIATGNKYEEVLDLSVSTPGIPLEFRRSYNSQANDDGTGPLGYRWTHNYELSVDVIQASGPRKVRIWDWDGRALYFTERSSGSEIIYYG